MRRTLGSLGFVERSFRTAGGVTPAAADGSTGPELAPPAECPLYGSYAAGLRVATYGKLRYFSP
jgi:hypothetical protein